MSSPAARSARKGTHSEYPVGTRDSGFTLLEIVVALAILGLSLTVIFGIFSQSIARNRSNDVGAGERAFAASLLAEEMATDRAPVASAGRASGDLNWRIDVAPFGSGDDAQAWPQKLEQVTVTVWRSDIAGPPVALRTLRIVPKTETPS